MKTLDCKVRRDSHGNLKFLVKNGSNSDYVEVYTGNGQSRGEQLQGIRDKMESILINNGDDNIDVHEARLYL